MNDMFSGCQNLKSIDLSYFDTKKVADMNNMFCGCQNLKSIDLSYFGTKNVNKIGGIFSFCKNLKILVWIVCFMDLKILLILIYLHYLS